MKEGWQTLTNKEEREESMRLIMQYGEGGYDEMAILGVSTIIGKVSDVIKNPKSVIKKESKTSFVPLFNPNFYAQAMDTFITSTIVIDNYARKNLPTSNIKQAITGEGIFGINLTEEERKERLNKAGKLITENVDSLAFAGSLKVKGLNLSTLPKNALNSTISSKAGPNSAKSGINQLEPYAGVKQASEYLKSQGVSRRVRKKVLESFDRRTIYMDEAGKNTFGIRYHDFGVKAEPKGQYLYETFQPLSTREGAAIKWQWNEMQGISQYQVKPGTSIIKGKAASQMENGVRYEGGIEQWWINLNKLIKP